MALQAHRSTVCLRAISNPITFAFIRCAGTSAGAFKAPPYPYGPSTHYRRRDTGLYGSASIQFGNLVSEKNEHKSRRVWRPNIHNKRLWSNYLGRFLRAKITSRVLRTLDKLGGLDEYLVGSDTPARIKELGIIGWQLRWRVMQTRGYRERAAAERRKLGLPERGWAVEEKDRRRLERKDALIVAEAYLDAVKVEKREAREQARRAGSVEEAFEQATDNVVEELEASSAVDEQVEAQETTETESGYKVEEDMEEQEEEDDATERYNDEAVDLTTQDDQATTLRPSEQLYAQLTTIATQMNSHPNSLLKQARDLIADRTIQSAASAAQNAKLADERADTASTIDNALASLDTKPILNLYSTLLRRARSENVRSREETGKKPLSHTQTTLHVLGPPSLVEPAQWALLRSRVREIKKEAPRLLKERQVVNLERRRVRADLRAAAESKRVNSWFWWRRVGGWEGVKGRLVMGARKRVGEGEGGKELVRLFERLVGYKEVPIGGRGKVKVRGRRTWGAWVWGVFGRGGKSKSVG